MITFLPLSCFASVARLLDDKRLGSQRVEALFILRCVRNADGRYQRFQRAGYCRMWIGYEQALAVYYNVMVDEWNRRGYKTDLAGFDMTVQNKGQADVPLPAWLGEDRLHATHRAALLFKDPAHYGSLGWSEQPCVQYLWPLRLEDGSWDLVPPRTGQSRPLAKKREEQRAKRTHWMSRRRIKNKQKSDDPAHHGAGPTHQAANHAASMPRSGHDSRRRGVQRQAYSKKAGSVVQGVAKKVPSLPSGMRAFKQKLAGDDARQLIDEVTSSGLSVKCFKTLHRGNQQLVIEL
eukprot:TRINITY_DN65771_c0_g1_i1.p1 TRINITY_DN65771_c0_g1~~TRINITY_DN65771_c0_g1_i1.p1  ORF type:complete len:291 (+),score=42.49 TRINITY_DN65771_c0_g1_i1:234-1106(+)